MTAFTPKSIAFRADASLEIGTGHVMRCLSVADRLRELGHHSIFLCRELPGDLRQAVRVAGHELFSLPAPKSEDMDRAKANPVRHGLWLATDLTTDARQCATALAGRHIDALVVDHYALHSSWETAARSWATRIAVIDDLADRDHDCDLLLDQNLRAGQEQAHRAHLPNRALLLLGPRYALLRQEFAEKKAAVAERQGGLHRLLVFMGGADPGNETSKAIEAVLASGLALEVDVVLGGSNPHKENIRQQLVGRPAFRLHENISYMARLMAEADLGLGCGGATTWERCCLGLPSLLIAVAFNQEEVSRMADLVRVAVYLGPAAEVGAEKIAGALRSLAEKPGLLREISTNCLQLVDGRGVERFVSALLESPGRDT
jgi:UDP-2,4-diacetamido-2,4,6-trideoxy-beta-L-altropyranose hydrolase